MTTQVGLGLSVTTLGCFELSFAGEPLPAHLWKRDKSLQLFQYLLTTRGAFLHREVVTNALWPELTATAAERDFKVALNGLQQALSVTGDSGWIRRNGVSYALDFTHLVLDAQQFEQGVAQGNAHRKTDPTASIARFREAVSLYKGMFLPNRPYDDWASDMRERLHVLALSTMTQLGDLVLSENPTESLHLAQQVLGFERGWEDAYRLAMRAYVALGNRPMALRTYEKCADVLADVYDVEPLPQTEQLYIQIKQL